jgi:hypothetical protein
MRSLLQLGVIVVFMSACSGDGRSPVSSTPTQPPVTFIFIGGGPSVLVIGSSATYTVTARLSSGATVLNAAPITWSIDKVDIASIDDHGRLTAHSPGGATITATYQGTSAIAFVRVQANNYNSGSTNLLISYEPDPTPGSLTPCTSAFWLGQTPTWSNVETIKETRGVGFTLKRLTYNYYNHAGVLISTLSFQDNHYFPPYDEHVEDGCVALGGSSSGSFEEILEGTDDNGNQLTFAKKVRLLPVED